jgi:4-aminobutyrate aminotransferase-like enzyme
MLPEIVTPIPGPRSRACAEKLSRFEAREVTWLAEDFPVFWDRADGVNVWDVDGNRFLDFTSAFAVSGLGHGAKPIRAALEVQAEKLLHAMGDVHPAAVKAELCELLSRITFERWEIGRGKAILCNSGSEAVEAALKTALLHSGKPGVISFTGGYHGLGFGALETIGIPTFREPFQSQLGRFAVRLPYPSCFRCPFGRREGFRLEGNPFPNCSTSCLEELQKQIVTTLRQREIGCILVEPIQGRGGEIAPPRDFLSMLRRICDHEKLLLILDEIYTGFNRTGKLFACEHFGITPDLICLGKALTGGFPLSACVGRADIMDAWPASQGEALHTSTTLGNPLGCAMAVASIAEHLKDETRYLVRSAGRKLKDSLLAMKASCIGNVRGVGALMGVELVKQDGEPYGSLAAAVMRQGLQDGLILVGGGQNGNVLSFAPPFAISDLEIEFLAAKLEDYLVFLPGSMS